MSGQPQFYLEQDFPFHPKIAMAGGDAAWLYVCGLAWACKHLTGEIPRAMVAQLSDRKTPLKLAARLCEVGLWHERGEVFEINDFETRNAKMLAARRKGKHAAQARWKDAPSNAPSMPDAMPDECTSNALEPKNQRTKEPSSNPPPPLTVVRAASPEAAKVLNRVVEAVAERQLAAATNVRNPSGWLVSARMSILREWRDYILEHSDDGVAALVDFIEPPPPPPKRDPNSAYTTDDGRTFLPGTGWVSASFVARLEPYVTET